MSFARWLIRELGFTKNTGYQNKYINETNIRTAVYMSFIVMVLELWMMIRYVQQRPGRTFTEYFDGETNYLILFSAALILFTFAFRYTKSLAEARMIRIVPMAVLALDVVMIGRYIFRNSAQMTTGQMLFGMKYHILLLILAGAYLIYEMVIEESGQRDNMYGQFMNVLFAVICLGFGIETSIYDHVSRDRQILCFMTMILFAACMLIWKPYASFVILAVALVYFYSKWVPHLDELDQAMGGKVLEGDRINYFIFWIVIVMLSISIYQQRRQEAEKDESLIEANKTLERVAVEDELTGIHNMFCFNQETESF